MKVKLILILLIILGTVNITAQTVLTKEEILESWNSFKKDSADLRHFTSNEKLNTAINSFIDSLNEQKIDTIIIYTISFPGYIMKSSCYNNLLPIDTYIFWLTKGKVNLKRMKGKCQFNIVNLDSSEIFNYLNDNKLAIQNEKIMPVILSVRRTNNGLITHQIHGSSHEPIYQLQLRIGESTQMIAFTDNDIENKQSLFHDHNLHMKSIQLWKRIEYEIMDWR